MRIATCKQKLQYVVLALLLPVGCATNSATVCGADGAYASLSDTDGVGIYCAYGVVIGGIRPCPDRFNGGELTRTNGEPVYVCSNRLGPPPDSICQQLGLACGSNAQTWSTPGATTERSVNFRASITGTIEDTELTRVQITDNVGTATINGVSYPAVVYEFVQASDYDFFFTLVSTRESVLTVTLSCYNGTLPYTSVTRSGRGTTQNTGAQGVCSFVEEPFTTRFAFPRMTLNPTPVTGFSYQGAGIHMDPTGRGAIEIDGNNYDMVMVGAAPALGFGNVPTEVMMWDAARGQLATGTIFVVRSTNAVVLNRGVQIPSLQSLPQNSDRLNFDVTNIEYPAGFD